MKRTIDLFIVFLCVAIMTGCAINPASSNTVESNNDNQEQHREDYSEHSPNVEENNSSIETDSVLFESNSFFLSLPRDCIDSVIVNPEADHKEHPEYTLFDVYYKPTYEAAKEEGYAAGKLFTIWQMDQAQYEQYLSGGDWINEYAFARDDSYYYIMAEPADMQVLSPEEWEPYRVAFESCCPAAMEALIQLNHLEEYSDDAFWESSETYSGEHKYLRYYPYRAYPEVETTENKEMYFTIMLSQPVKHGSDGIWCVERVYDAAEYGYIYAIFPNEDHRSAREVYHDLQASVDEGNNREFLDPLSVALEFVQSRYGHTRATADSFEEVSGPPDGHFVF